MVDDSKTNLNLMYQILHTPDRHFSMACSAKQAIEIIQTKKFDVILMDVMMPEMDGFALFDIIKKQGKNQTTPVIFISADTSHENIIRVFSKGGMDFIAKPFQPWEVEVRVNARIEQQKNKVSQIQKVVKNLNDHGFTEDEIMEILSPFVSDLPD